MDQRCFKNIIWQHSQRVLIDVDLLAKVEPKMIGA